MMWKCRMMNDERRMKYGAGTRRLLFCVVYSLFCVLVVGCSNHSTTQPTTRPLTTRERQDRAIKDPFNYSPDTESTDISGGDLSDFDKGGFNKDLKNALNP
jgi:hypothetical protein